MRLRMLSIWRNNYKGLSWSLLIALAASVFIINSLLILLIFFHHSPAYLLIALICSIILPALLSIWLKRHIHNYSQKIEKLTLITRRFQNISKYFESILQDSTDIILSIDTDGYILKFNRGAQLHFGYTQEEIVGKAFAFLFVNESDKVKIINAVLLAGKSVNEEIPLKTSSGSIILVNMSISEMKSDNNQIIGMVVTAKDITEKKKLEMELVKKNELLNKLAITDALTGLYNSRHFHDQIKRELSRFKRNPGRKLSLLLLDIDHFKDLNDTEGHQMGDHVLKSLGQVIKVCLRSDIDSGYRYGGDEFVILLPDTDKTQALVAAERIQKQFQAFKIGKTSLSMGISEAKDGENEQAFVKRTDEAMYRSKHEGRARITVV